MEILFYLAPVTEISEPLNKIGCYELLVPQIMDALLKAGYSDCNCSIVASEDLVLEIKRRQWPEHGTIYSFSQKECLCNYTVDGNREYTKWQEGNETGEWGDYLCSLFRKKLPAEYKPDIVFCYTPAYFLKKLYPETVFLYHEYAAFSRYPYMETFVFDPHGKGIRFLPSVCAREINQFPVSQASADALEAYRKKILSVLTKKNNVSDFFSDLRKRYKHLFILALGFETYFENTAFSHYQSQFEFIEHVLDSVGDDVGVLVTQHPHRVFVPKESINSLKLRCKNLISEELFYEIPCFSQTALAYCDGVITQSSTVGIQAVFLNKYFVSIGHYYSGLADCTDLIRFSQMLESPPRKRDSAILWMIMHYLTSKDHVADYLKKCLPQFRKIASESPENMVRDYPVFIPESELDEMFFKPAMAYCDDQTNAMASSTSIEVFYPKNSSHEYSAPSIYAFTGKDADFLVFDCDLIKENSGEIRIDFGQKDLPMNIRKFDIVTNDGMTVDLLHTKGILETNNVSSISLSDMVCCIPENNDPQFIIRQQKTIVKIELEYTFCRISDLIRNANQYVKEQQREAMLQQDMLKQEVLSVCNYFAKSNQAKLMHIAARTIKQFLLGPLSEKKAFVKWLYRHITHKPNPSDFRYHMGQYVYQNVCKLFNDFEKDGEPDLQTFNKNILIPYQKYDVIFFSVIDYSFRYQRPQQIADYFAKNGHRVFYINANFSHDRKISIKKLKDQLYEVTLFTDCVSAVYQDEMLQIREVLQEQIESLISDYTISDFITITEYPNWVPIASVLKDKCGAYNLTDYLDDPCGFESTATQQLKEMAKRSLQASDLIIASSEYLKKKALEYNSHVALIRNGTEFEHFRSAYVPQKAENIKKVIGYYGALSHWFDFNKVKYLAQRLPECDIILIGEMLGPADAFAECPNVRLLGEKKYAELPEYLKEMDVCLIPFDTSTSLIQATNPVKFYEYLSAGKKVVATEIPELFDFRDKYVYLTNDNEAFYQAVKKCLEHTDTLASPEECMGFARENDWSCRLAAFEKQTTLLFPKFSIIILSYNQWAYTRQCLDSILRWTAYPNYEIIVIDNASSDETPNELKKYAAKYSQIKLILNEKNLGFAAGNNCGLKIAEGDYIVLLNNDTIITHGWLSRMLDIFRKHPDAGAIGPVTNSIGNEATIPCCYTDLCTMQNFAAGLSAENAGKIQELKSLAMFCFVLPRQVFQDIGPISEQYGMGMFEDDDYCMMLRQKGYKLYCCEGIFIHHFLSASFNKVQSKERKELMRRNQLMYEKKWGCKWDPHTYRLGVNWDTNKAIEEWYTSILNERIETDKEFDSRKQRSESAYSNIQEQKAITRCNIPAPEESNNNAPV